jgi:cell wall-associated NlpC family hydrolase
LYIGGGQFVHAPHTGDVVKISSLYDSWYASTYVGAKRVT